MRIKGLKLTTLLVLAQKKTENELKFFRSFLLNETADICVDKEKVVAKTPNKI